MALQGFSFCCNVNFCFYWVFIYLFFREILLPLLVAVIFICTFFSFHLIFVFREILLPESLLACHVQVLRVLGHYSIFLHLLQRNRILFFLKLLEEGIKSSFFLVNIISIGELEGPVSLLPNKFHDFLS